MTESVRDKISNGDYDNHIPVRVDPVPIDEDTMTVRQAREHQEAEKERSRGQRSRHNEEEARMMAIFKADLEIENGVSGNPKSEKLFSLAWSHGHSSGYMEVTNFYEEFVELIR